MSLHNQIANDKYLVSFYDYDVVNTNKTVIDDPFFGIARFAPQCKMTERVWVGVASGCVDDQVGMIQSIGDNFVECFDGFSLSISDGFKFSQGNYRYFSGNYGYMCDKIFQDMVKVSLKIQGFGACECVIDETLFDFVMKCVEQLDSISPAEINIIEIFQEIISKNEVMKAEFQPGIIGDPISRVSISGDQSIVPCKYKVGMENNLAGDISVDLKFSGTTFNSTIRIAERIFSEMFKFS